MRKNNKTTYNSTQEQFISSLTALKKKALVAYFLATSRLEQLDSPLSLFSDKTNFAQYWADIKIVINHYELCGFATFNQFKKAFAKLLLKYADNNKLEQACLYATLAEQFPKNALLFDKIAELNINKQL